MSNGRFRGKACFRAAFVVSSIALTCGLLSACATMQNAVEGATKPLAERGLSEVTRGVGELVLLNARSAELGGAAASVDQVRKAAAVVVGDTANLAALDPDAVVSARDIRSGSRITVTAFGSTCVVDVVFLSDQYSALPPQCS